MIIKALTNGAISGANILVVPSGIVGGVLVSADGTNDATVVVRRENSTGKPIIHVVSKIPIWINGPFWTEEPTDDKVYVSVSGTGALAQVYEWIE